MLFQICVVYLILTFALVSGEQCDEYGTLIYEDLGCTPEYGDNKTCPIKYSCKELKASSTQCQFRGKIYEEREHVEDTLSRPSCLPKCTCDGKGGFTCVIVDCPFELGWASIKPGCYLNYTLDNCCADGQVCPPFDNMEKCVVDGKKYREGDQFSPSNTCYDCVCQKGFEGKFEEPFCKRTLCGKQLLGSQASIDSFCAAFYSSRRGTALCCPDAWLCPDGSELIKGEAKSEETCKFGDKQVKVGQYFDTPKFVDSYGQDFSDVKCECVMPPMMTCLQK